MEALNTAPIDCGVAALTLAGQPASGDRHLVKAVPNGVLVAVVDGLGHGPEAAATADLAIRALEGHAQRDMVALLKQCHNSLRDTRGAAMSLACYDTRDATMTWLGVGNVEGLWLRPDARDDARKSLLLRPGVVGRQLPALSPDVITVRRNDLLILASDGIRTDFGVDLIATDSPQRIADRILASHRKWTDDALVLVSRYVGAERPYEAHDE